MSGIRASDGVARQVAVLRVPADHGGVGYGILSRRFAEHVESDRRHARSARFSRAEMMSPWTSRRGRRKHTGLDKDAVEAVERTMGEERNDAPAPSSGTRTRRRAARAERVNVGMDLL
jgi:hypothetical protein